ncbi:protein-L-isoaspartate(D-aspartate) O-methyltransferase [Pararhodospirillum photometricum]|uniref:Protein-L-isoaspartate O-methyltransferase n=1 Tax=Pararhodospirillum photometricum DSM 122 TaxID=1150469 RepID=H6SLL7_PARPM|nr:protein-L-isoaspartate(D-aspartate) O-methyltransferase [Pararhodospirillum photometricum]CCG08882.1 Protein-L-isoaspartate O-methyltransferase [Pararhodospirillum photometricum DSM 122]
MFNTHVLSALERVPRELFVPQPFANRAFENAALPIGCGQTISQPLVVGLMTQALALTDRHKVLEIGTGSGYQTAVLARLCRRVYTVERHGPLLAEAQDRLARLGIRNVVAREGDGYRGWPEQAPFERILVTAAAPDIPRTLVEHLAVGGLMVLPVGEEDGLQHVVRVRRYATHIQTETLFPVRFVPMVEGLPPRVEGEVVHYDLDDDALEVPVLSSLS